jgi:O-antigen/teichoic acid export membrane protein
MKRKFATSLVLMLVLNLLVKPFWIFGIDRTVQNIVGAGEYGLFFALFNFSLLLNILLDFGLTNFNNRDISRHSQLLPRYFSHMVVIKFLMAIAYLIISFTLALLLGYTGRQLWILAFLVLNQFLASFVLYLRSNISGLQMFKTDSLLSVADRILMIGLCAVLLWGPFRENFKIEWFVYAQTISYLVTAAIAFTLVALQAGWVKPRYDRAFLVSIFKQSYPYALLVLLMSFYYRIDTVMLERMLPDGDIQSGIYAQAFRLLDAANMVPYLFATLLLPMFSKMIKSGEPIQPLLGLAFSLLIVTAFSLGSAGIIYREPIMDTLYVQHSVDSSVVFGVLMVSFVFISITYIFGTLLTANGSLRYLNIISAVGVVTNIGLNLVLIPRYMVVGAAYSSLITQGLMSILQVVLVLKLFKFNINRTQCFSFCIYIAGAILFSFLSRHSVSHWFTGFILAIGSSVVLAFLVRLIKIEELFSLFLNRKSVSTTSQIDL